MEKIKSIFCLCFLTAILSGCNRTTLSGPERDAVLQYANPMVESILAGYNERDYAKYSKNFDEAMKNALPEKVFNETSSLIDSKIGKFISRDIKEVYKENQYIVVLYNGKFEKEDGVEIKLVTQTIENQKVVSGLWFNSPKLRN